jgi:hypothetical protein
LLQILNPIHQSHCNFPKKPLEPSKSKFSTHNFFVPYLFNRNSESGDSYAKILRIISSFSSIYSYAYDCCICVIVCLSVKRIVPEPMYEDFQEQVYEDFKMKYTRTPIFSFQSNEASHLEHVAPIVIFSIYSVELELHDRKV